MWLVVLGFSVWRGEVCGWRISGNPPENNALRAIGAPNGAVARNRDSAAYGDPPASGAGGGDELQSQRERRARLRPMAHIRIAWATPIDPCDSGPPDGLTGAIAAALPGDPGGVFGADCVQWRSYPSPGLRPPDRRARLPPGPVPRALPLAIPARHERKGSVAGRPRQPRCGSATLRALRENTSTREYIDSIPNSGMWRWRAV